MAERKDSSDVTVIETGAGSGLKWFAVGALIGAGLGLLLAPQSGEQTRRNLARRARTLRDQAEEKLEQLSEEIEGRGRQLKEAVEEWTDELTDDVDEGVRTTQRKAHGAREELERRLASARARRRSAVAADGVAEDEEADD